MFRISPGYKIPPISKGNLATNTFAEKRTTTTTMRKKGTTTITTMDGADVYAPQKTAATPAATYPADIDDVEDSGFEGALSLALPATDYADNIDDLEDADLESGLALALPAAENPDNIDDINDAEYSIVQGDTAFQEELNTFPTPPPDAEITRRTNMVLMAFPEKACFATTAESRQRLVAMHLIDPTLSFSENVEALKARADIFKHDDTELEVVSPTPVRPFATRGIVNLGDDFVMGDATDIEDGFEDRAWGDTVKHGVLRPANEDLCGLQLEAPASPRAVSCKSPITAPAPLQLHDRLAKLKAEMMRVKKKFGVRVQEEAPQKGEEEDVQEGEEDEPTEFIEYSGLADMNREFTIEEHPTVPNSRSSNEQDSERSARSSRPESAESNTTNEEAVSAPEPKMITVDLIKQRVAQAKQKIQSVKERFARPLPLPPVTPRIVREIKKIKRAPTQTPSRIPKLTKLIKLKESLRTSTATDISLKKSPPATPDTYIPRFDKLASLRESMNSSAESDKPVAAGIELGFVTVRTPARQRGKSFATPKTAITQSGIPLATPKNKRCALLDASTGRPSIRKSLDSGSGSKLPRPAAVLGKWKGMQGFLKLLVPSKAVKKPKKVQEPKKLQIDLSMCDKTAAGAVLKSGYYSARSASGRYVSAHIKAPAKEGSKLPRWKGDRGKSVQEADAPKAVNVLRASVVTPVRAAPIPPTLITAIRVPVPSGRKASICNGTAEKTTQKVSFPKTDIVIVPAAAFIPKSVQKISFPKPVTVSPAAPTPQPALPASIATTLPSLRQPLTIKRTEWATIFPLGPPSRPRWSCLQCSPRSPLKLGPRSSLALPPRPPL